VAIPGSPTIEDAIQDIAATGNFIVRSHVLEISGICAACANTSN
jgi:Fe2+ or Zn2+ uptake regulation protein